MKRDELNILADKYYSVMDIPEEKKEKRKEDAWELFDLFMLFFLWFKEAEEKNVEDNSYFLPRFQNELQDVVSSITFIDDYLISYLATIALGIYTATVAHLNEKYYLSEDRAVNLALNESNTINNYLDTKDAEKEGYTHKKWVAQLDERTRLEHIMMDGTVVPIDGYFEFSDCRMFAPHDVVNGTANQVANCRCSLEYLVKYESSNAIQARHTKHGKYNVNWNTVRSKEYTRRFAVLSENQKANELVAKYARNALGNRDGQNTEEIYAINMTTEKYVGEITDQHNPFGIKRDEKFISDIKRQDVNGNKIITVHNHPNGTPPSYADLNELRIHENVSGIAVGHDGSLYYYTKPNEVITERDFAIAENHFKYYTDYTERHVATLELLSKKFGFEFFRF